MATTSEPRVEDENKTILSSPTPDVVSATEKAGSCETKEAWPSPVVVSKDHSPRPTQQPRKKRNLTIAFGGTQFFMSAVPLSH